MESMSKSKLDPRENIEQELQIKSKTTKQILQGLNECLGVSKRTKGIIKMYADYIKLYKQKKIKIGNFNMILYSDTNNYKGTVDVINKLLYKEGIVKFSNYELVTDVLMGGRYNIGANDLCVVTDDNLKDFKLENLMNRYPNCVFIVICNNNNMQMIHNVSHKFTWEIEVAEPTEQEKAQYIKDTIKEHGLIPKVTTEELRAITCYDMEEINSNLIGAILTANKKKLDYIGKEELHIIPAPPKEGMNKLNAMVGLESVKEQVKQIINYVQIHKERGALPSLHMVFKGNPGTGKTEVARIIGEIFSDYGILEGRYTEVSRADLVGGYVGQTALKTAKVINNSLGGVLFIDEAYSLFSDDNYSRECISTLIKAMEDHREDLCVIMAGYSKDMEKLLDSNKGFQSRIQFYIDFTDYSEDELYQIFNNMLEQEQFKLDKKCKNTILEYFSNEIKNNRDNFSNGRMVRNLFEKVKFEQATRITEKKLKDYDLITTADVTAVIDRIKSRPKSIIGFSA